MRHQHTQLLPIYFSLLFSLYFGYFHLGVNYQDIGFNGAGLSGGAVSEQLGGLLAPVSVQNLAALAAIAQPPVVTQAPAAAPQQTAPQLCKYSLCLCRF